MTKSASLCRGATFCCRLAALLAAVAMAGCGVTAAPPPARSVAMTRAWGRRRPCRTGTGSPAPAAPPSRRHRPAADHAVRGSGGLRGHQPVRQGPAAGGRRQAAAGHRSADRRQQRRAVDCHAVDGAADRRHAEGELPALRPAALLDRLAGAGAAALHRHRHCGRQDRHQRARAARVVPDLPGAGRPAQRQDRLQGPGACPAGRREFTPTAFFQDSPAWVPDGATDGYVRTCQGTRVGDPINPAYWDKIVAAAMINDAMNSYNAGRYEEALDLYRGVARAGGGDQLRVYNGLYLATGSSAARTRRRRRSEDRRLRHRAKAHGGEVPVPARLHAVPARSAARSASTRSGSSRSPRAPASARPAWRCRATPAAPAPSR